MKVNTGSLLNQMIVKIRQAGRPKVYCSKQFPLHGPDGNGANAASEDFAQKSELKWPTGDLQRESVGILSNGLTSKHT